MWGWTFLLSLLQTGSRETTRVKMFLVFWIDESTCKHRQNIWALQEQEARTNPAGDTHPAPFNTFPSFGWCVYEHRTDPWPGTHSCSEETRDHLWHEPVPPEAVWNSKHAATAGCYSNVVSQQRYAASPPYGMWTRRQDARAESEYFTVVPGYYYY